MVKISKMVDYSVLVLCQMAVEPLTSWSASYLADKLGLNQPTLAKICRLLAKAGMLSASRGAQGGYVLSKAPEEMSLYAVVIAIDGHNPLVSCEKKNAVCPCIPHCGLQPIWIQIDNEMKVVLERKTMADFLKQRKGYCSVIKKQEKAFDE
jgi:Rrf2 family protein